MTNIVYMLKWTNRPIEICNKENQCKLKFSLPNKIIGKEADFIGGINQTIKELEHIKQLNKGTPYVWRIYNVKGEIINSDSEIVKRISYLVRKNSNKN